jgi:hypothetical protein
MIKRTIALCLLSTFISVFITALPADSDILSFDKMTSFLSSQQKSDLLNTGELTEFHFSSFDPLLLPDVGMVNEIRSMVLKEELNMGIEGLFLFKDFDSAAYNANPETTKLALYNALRSVSTLEGIEYYSASREEMRTLFVESWMIPDLDSARNRLSDSIVTTIPGKDSFFIHQKDKSFGRHESVMEFVYSSPVIWSVIINQTPMYYKGFLKAMNPQQLQIHLLVMPTDQGLLVYGFSAADRINIRAFREKANNSFYNRVKALYAWYIGRIQ